MRATHCWILPRCALIAALALSAGAPAWAADDDTEEGERIYAIQARKYMLGHEFAGSLGVLPMDAFSIW